MTYQTIFLDQARALPSGEGDTQIRIEPPHSGSSQETRKMKPAEFIEVEEEESHCDPTLVRSGRIFGGLIADVKRKLPWYGSDFKDCLHIQCVASVIYLYLATLINNIIFGGLLGDVTELAMGAMECILSAFIVGVLFALFAGQPLNILGSTGPMLLFEMILYHFCLEYQIEFLPFRCWIGIWTTIILMFIVAFDLSALIRYITRFTEESFACLFAVIFIIEAIKKLAGIWTVCSLKTDPDPTLNDDFNNTLKYPLYNDNSVNWTIQTKTDCIALNGTPTGPGCDITADVPYSCFPSLLLFIGTFIIAIILTLAKNCARFPSYVKQTIADFAVVIAVICMVGLDAAIGLHTQKLVVPLEFKPTHPHRGWFIVPISDHNPLWLIPAAIIPALLATILIFTDQQITAAIVNRKENQLKKGSGYHLDLLVVAICIVICSFFGLPWFMAATVPALAHVMSLKKESECTGPGERPTLPGVREQRVTALLVGILSGLTVFFASVLKFIPMAVLYGVLLYMGVAALRGMQLNDRLLLIFMPAKYHPDHGYLRHVPMRKIHLFTAIQVICLVVLWVIKLVNLFRAVPIFLPTLVLGTCFVRKALNYVFSSQELKWLDDLIPDAAKKAKEDALHQNTEEVGSLTDGYDKMAATERVNNSEEMADTAI